MTPETQERYAAAMQLFINHVEAAIEDKTSDWKDKNPYWEIDGDDGLPERCPPTTSQDARESLTDEFISSGENVEIASCADFFEFVVNEIYGFGIGDKNPYKTPKNKELTAEERAIASINIGTANFINELCGSLSK